MRKLLLGAASALLLAGCGAREPLELAPSQNPPPVPIGATEPLTSDQMLRLPPDARPERVDELLTESEEREDDRFDLPPD